jgi:hypothetical protein
MIITATAAPMRFPGYCQECRRFKQVSITPAELSKNTARGNATIIGRCDQCVKRAPRSPDEATSVNRSVAKTRLILKPLEK